MEIEARGAVPSPRRPVQLTGVSAELADTRAALRQATPTANWAAVLAEVGRLQVEESMSPLAAMKAVYARIAAGWLPR